MIILTQKQRIFNLIKSFLVGFLMLQLTTIIILFFDGLTSSFNFEWIQLTLILMSAMSYGSIFIWPMIHAILYEHLTLSYQKRMAYRQWHEQLNKLVWENANRSMALIKNEITLDEFKKHLEQGIIAHYKNKID